MANVAKEDYWTTILNDPTQIGQITTLDEEFNRRVNNVNVVLSNTFINSSDENLISKWETSLYIDETEGKTITERKADILYKLCVKNYVPVSIIKRFLLNLIGDENRFAIEFIKDENKLVIHTDRISDEMNESVTSLLENMVLQNVEVVRYNHDIEVSWRDINKYAECVTYNDLVAVNPNYKKDLTSEGEWLYHMPKFNEQQVSGLFNKSNVVYMDYVGDVVNAISFVSYSYQLKKLKFKANEVIWFGDFATVCPRLEEVEIDCPRCRYAGNNWFHRCTSLREIRFLKKLSFGYDSRNYSFDGALLSKASVLNIFEQVIFNSPQSITLGIHIDYENDPDIMEVIENGRVKGWPISVQWNGNRTNSTNTLDFGRLIYARVLEDENGEKNLEWGHYVTHPEEYETFRSLESAYKYFNLEQPTEIYN